MYKHQPTNKRQSPRVPLSFIHGEIKNTIDRIFYQEKNYGWNYKKRIFTISDIFSVIGLPAIFNVEANKPDPFNRLISARFDTDENEIILVVGTFKPELGEKTSCVSTRDDILDVLSNMTEGENIRVSIRVDMKRHRQDAPARVHKVFNFNRLANNEVSLISDYDFVRATAPIDKEKSHEIAKRLEMDYSHSLHEFIQTHQQTHGNKFKATSAKFIEETLANWSRVY